MIDYSYLVMRCLVRAVKRDAEKGGGGLRDTVEVAEWVGCTVRQARDTLNRLCDAELVDCYEAHPLLWRLAETEPDAPEDQPDHHGLPLAA